MRKRKSFKPKRSVCCASLAQERLELLRASNLEPRYGSNPEHKRNPGDFGLDPPAAPRLGKSLCDSIGIFTRTEALALLRRRGFSQGLFSEQIRDGWPQNIWAVTAAGQPMEAHLEGTGVYHGYPMPEDDPFREEVLARWVHE
ncbi:MAG: hypothetical protein HYX27_04880 [Acidobacteria bacterium]|nr:hypothetical protein [Acidobacteriota bacterium]